MTLLMTDDADVSGEAILSGQVVTAPEIPEFWTPEYAEWRIREAFKTLRTIGGRVGPGSGSAWPEYMHTFEDIREWADEHRNEVWGTMERAKGRPDGVAVKLMDEALQWPAKFLSDRPEYADTVGLIGMCRAWHIEPSKVLRSRMHRAKAMAGKAADEENARRKVAREAAVAEINDWAEAKYRERNIASRPPEKRAEAIEVIRNQARIKIERIAKKIVDVKPRPTLAMPGKILSESTLNRTRLPAFRCLADRLDAAGVEVR